MRGTADSAEGARVMTDHRNEILSVLRSRGVLTKEEVMTTWGLSVDQYAELKKFLAAQDDVEPGSKGTGGFVMKPPGRRPVEPEPNVPPPTSHAGGPWEAAAVRRLYEIFQHRELEDLLGALVYTVRQSRKLQTGEDRRGTKLELAKALLLKHGIDLLRAPDVRELVARRCKLKSPRRWHPGKGTARAFAAESGFPLELAGIPSEDPPTDFEYLEGRVDLKPLQDFQDEVKTALRARLEKAQGRAIVTLPTGAGKTRVAVECIRDWLTARTTGDDGAQANTVLWLAHSGELCEQAYSDFRQIWQASVGVCPLLLFRFWSRFTADFEKHRETLAEIRERPSVLISTPQRVVNLLEDQSETGKAVLADLLATVSLVVVDEAHRGAAPSYRRILDAFGSSVRAPAVAGLTATPIRAEYLRDAEAGTRELVSLFGNLIEARRLLGDNPREVLQQRGVLARPVVDTVKTSTVLDSPLVATAEEASDEDVERIDRALGLRADNPQRRLAVFQHILPYCRNPENSVLYFGPSVLDAECMAFLLRQEGIIAEVVSGNTRDVTRRRLIQEFRVGRIRVLCNCEVLTTGFDAPRVSHVVMARPTVSTVLYEQMVGRGLRGRLFGGTEECLIVDCEDNYRTNKPVLGYENFRHIWAPRRRMAGRGNGVDGSRMHRAVA